jgi:hypothetical protein
MAMARLIRLFALAWSLPPRETGSPIVSLTSFFQFATWLRPGRGRWVAQIA